MYEIYGFFQICEEFGSIRTICQGKSNEKLIVGTTHNCILTGDLLIGMQTVLAHGHENDIRTLLSPFNGQFLSCSTDKWIRMWDIKKHCVVWNYYAGVSNFHEILKAIYIRLADKSHVDRNTM